MSVITANVPKARYSLVVGVKSTSETGGMPADFTCCKESPGSTWCKEELVIRFWSCSCSVASFCNFISILGDEPWAWFLVISEAIADIFIWMISSQE